jgi:16S rRNA (uracil1498-N3)-methyltransferase
MAPRLYCPAVLAAGAVVDLPPEAAHHAKRVLRLGEGDEIILFDGQGAEFDASLLRDGQARIDARREVDREAPLRVTLIQALPAADKMDWVVQKAVELGVGTIQPVAAKRSVLRLSGERQQRRIEHWQQVAVSACEQCGRNRVPIVAPLLDLPHYLGLGSNTAALRLLLSPEAVAPLSGMARPQGEVHLLVGPEGGFEAGELLAAASAGFQPVRLGPRILRTETAGLASLAAMMALWGDF